MRRHQRRRHDPPRRPDRATCSRGARDECVLWHAPAALPREPTTPKARGPPPGTQARSRATASTTTRDVWNGWWVRVGSPPRTSERFDGQTGATLDDVVVAGYAPGQDWGYGPYGGAVDADGNFWVTGTARPPHRASMPSRSTFRRIRCPTTLGPLRHDRSMATGTFGRPASTEANTHPLRSRTRKTFDRVPDAERLSCAGLMVDRNGQAVGRGQRAVWADPVRHRIANDGQRQRAAARAAPRPSASASTSTASSGPRIKPPTSPSSSTPTPSRPPPPPASSSPTPTPT